MSIIAIYIALITSLFASIVPLVFARLQTCARITSFSLLGTSGIAAAIGGIKALIAPATIIYTVNFANHLWCFKLDPLAGFFLTIVGVVVTSVAIYAPGYLQHQSKSTTSLTVFTGLFVATMYLVILANDVFSFMFTWELMSITSYFLVAYYHEQQANYKAAFVYLLMAQVSGLFILTSYAVLLKFSNGSSFAALHAAHLPAIWANITFFTALIGFGIKAGIVPLHVWLPQAHPAAPCHISALMSGAMIKIAVYGFLRLSLDILPTLYWQWGFIVLLLGIISAVVGVLYALVQNDIKKLLAYCSVENIGIIFVGIGLALIFISTKHYVLGALGLIAALYHCLNHAIFKSLLFFGAGTIINTSHEQNLEKMGGLIHVMPYTALFFLIGCLSISALPLTNGFVSEWLTLQTALQATALPQQLLHIVIPLIATLLVLTGALAATCFAKVYGIAFLGKSRSLIAAIPKTRCNLNCEGYSMGILTLCCLLLGICPTLIIKYLNNIPQQFLGIGLTNTNNWLWLTPTPAGNATYSPPLILFGVILIATLTYLSLKLSVQAKIVKATKPWECGFGAISGQMQCSATAFVMPIRRVFKNIWHVTETVQTINSSDKDTGYLIYQLHIGDWLWQYLYEPLSGHLSKVAQFCSRMQTGNVRTYVAYMFVTLLMLLWITA